MRESTRGRKREVAPDELTLAIGLVWGHLSAGQFEQAGKLSRGCLSIWPDEERLLLMHAFAQVELLLPLDPATREAVAASGCREWSELILRRAELQKDFVAGEDRF